MLNINIFKFVVVKVMKNVIEKRKTVMNDLSRGKF